MAGKESRVGSLAAQVLALAGQVAGALRTTCSANASLRQRFGIEDKNYATASRIIAETIKAGLVRLYDPDSGSRKNASYVPFWA